MAVGPPFVDPVRGLRVFNLGVDDNGARVRVERFEAEADPAPRLELFNVHEGQVFQVGNDTVSFRATDERGVFDPILSVVDSFGSRHLPASSYTDRLGVRTCRFNTTLMREGAARLQLTATDTTGQTSEVGVSITVNNLALDTEPPVVRITYPTVDAIFPAGAFRSGEFGDFAQVRMEVAVTDDSDVRSLSGEFDGQTGFLIRNPRDGQIFLPTPDTEHEGAMATYSFTILKGIGSIMAGLLPENGADDPRIVQAIRRGEITTGTFPLGDGDYELLAYARDRAGHLSWASPVRIGLRSMPDAPRLPGQILRGDVNSDEVVNVSDGIALLNRLYLGTGTISRDAADFNDDGRLDSTDAIRIFNFLYLNPNLRPAYPYPLPGWDLTPDGLDPATLPPDPPFIITESLPRVFAGQQMRLPDIEVAGGVGPFRTLVISWDGPNGSLTPIRLDGGYLLEFQQGQEGLYTLRIAIVDATGYWTAKSFFIAAEPPAALEIPPQTLPAATTGSFYATQLRATGGVGTYYWHAQPPGLPAGMFLSPSGLLYGTPGTKSAGKYALELMVVDDARSTATVRLALEVRQTK
ncbi:MAG: outer membrane autotransporter barrel domain-containing [Planctomycetota bacterium]|nr:MAG: outer membrane autotransporter barrel domain-containing [Planctomycetota bacterium]